jgi:tetratricopeptide (TPR) repeat protein
MVVDPRRDHSLRVPRPDLSAAIGVPNACSGCHADRQPRWAAEVIAAWSGKPVRRHFAEALAAGRRLGSGMRQSILDLIADPLQPAIARATALQMLPAFAVEDLAAAVRRAATDREPLMRMAATTAAAALAPDARIALLRPLLDDSLRLIRIEAAHALAVVRNDAPADLKRRIDRGLEEFEAAQNLNSDQPQAHVNLAALFSDLGARARAEKAYLTALEVGPYFVPAYVNLADLYRSQGRDADAEAILRRGLARTGDDASLHHSLGLTLVRQGESDEAVEELRRAYEIEPQTGRYGYVYGVALSSLGRRDEALAVLKKVSDEHPADADVLIALATIYRDGGDKDAALRYARQLLREWPSSRAAMQLGASLGASTSR